MPTPLVSVVLPAYQLGDVLEANLVRVRAALAAVENVEVVVVNDGSFDGTAAVLAAMEGDDVRVVTHPRNLGKGHALVSGWEASRGELVVFLDADLDLPPEQVPAMLGGLEAADVVVGTKSEAMRRGDYPRLRTFLSRVYSATTSRMFGLPVDETQTGLKLFRRSVLDEALPQMRIMGYAFDLELLVRAHRAGFRIVPLPVDLAESARGASFRLSMAWELARDAARLRWWVLRDGGWRRGSAASDNG